MDSKYIIPKDLFKFVSQNQNDINALTYSLSDFLRKRQPNPYAVLVCLTDVVEFIVENNFSNADDLDHLELLVSQTLEAYTNAILDSAEEIAAYRFGKPLKSLPISRAPRAANEK